MIKKKSINADYSALTEKIETNLKALKFKINDRGITTKYKDIFSKNYSKNWPIEIYITDSSLKTNPRIIKFKI